MTFQELPFLDVFKDVSGGNIKTPQKEFLEEGEIPVVDQGQGLVAGFVNDRSRVCNAKPPVIVFGDHTRAIKYVDFEFAMGADGTKVLVPKVESDTKYLYYALNAIEIPAAGYSRHYKFLKETQIPLPPLAEQKRIAGILDAADALRAKRRVSLAELDNLLQATFLDMFGDPVTNPMGWEVMPLGNAFDLKHGFAFKSDQFVQEGEYVLLTPGNFFEKGGFRDREEKQRYHNDPVPQEYVLKEGDLLVAMTEQAPGLLGSPILVPESRKFLHNQRLGKVVEKIEIDSLFIFELMNASSIRARIQLDSTGTKVKHTSPKKIAAIEVGIPPLELQRRFAAIVGSVEQQKACLRVHLDELDVLFASLQSRAFNGEL